MKKTTLFTVTSLGLLATGAVVGGIFALGSNSSTTSTNMNVNNNTSNNYGSVSSSGSSSASENQVTHSNYVNANKNATIFSLSKNQSRTTFDKQYTLNIQQSFKEGMIYLFNDAGHMFNSSMPVNPGDRITVKVDFNNDFKDTHTLTDLWVYSATENLRLATYEGKGGMYYFYLPEATISSPEGGTISNPFYNGNNTISIKPFFNIKASNSWQYDYNSKAYKFVVTEDHIDKELGGIYLTDSQFYLPSQKEVSPNLDLVFRGEYVKNEKGEIKFNDYGNPMIKEQTKYILDLNGYDAYFSHFTIPSGVNFELMNSKWDIFTDRPANGNDKDGSARSRIFGSRRVSRMSIDNHGQFTRWHGIEEVRLGHEDAIVNEGAKDNFLIEGYPGDGIDHHVGKNRNEHKTIILRGWK